MADDEVEPMVADGAVAVPDVDPRTTEELAHEAARLYREVGDSEDALKQKKNQHDAVCVALKRRMEEAKIPQIAADDDHGGRVTMFLQDKTFVNVAAKDRAALVAWLKANGCEALVKEDVPSSTLGAHCREIERDGGEMPPMVKVAHVTRVAFRST